MLIGVPKEIKDHEYRVGLIPDSVRALSGHGHRVVVQRDAGTAINFTDDHYRDAGAEIAPDINTVYAQAGLIIQVKAANSNGDDTGKYTRC